MQMDFKSPNFFTAKVFYCTVVVLTGIPIECSVIVALTGLPIGYSVIVALQTYYITGGTITSSYTRDDADVLGT